MIHISGVPNNRYTKYLPKLMPTSNLVFHMIVNTIDKILFGYFESTGNISLITLNMLQSENRSIVIVYLI